MAKVWKFNNDVNTDTIIPGRYNITTVPEELAKYAFIEARPEFAGEVKDGDIIVAGENFGCGSSREHAAIALKATGIKCIIAKSFARIFYRNAINIGLPVMICTELWDDVANSQSLDVDLENGIIKDDNAKTYNTTKLPEFVLKIVNSGGIVKFLKEHDIDELIKESA